MKKIIALVLIAILTMGLAASGFAMQIPNPWTDTDAEGLQENLGFSLNVPASAQNVVYRLLEADGMGEAQFVWQGVEYTLRAKAANEFEDISGLNYTGWTVDEACEVRYCEGVFRQIADGEKLIDACLWYDAAPGIMYSLTAAASDGFVANTVALANVLFQPVQGDADETVCTINALALLNVLDQCWGFEGTAGASLKQASAALNILDFAVVNEAANCETEHLTAEYALAAALLSEDAISEIAGVCALTDAAIADYEAVKGQFADAGAEAIEEIINAEGAAENWEAFTAVIGG